MQGHLCRFTHGPHEQQQTNDRDQRDGSAPAQFDGIARKIRSLLKHRRVIEGTEMGLDQGNPEQKAQITHPIHQECLEVGINGCGPGIPKADQQIGHQANRLPAKKQLDEIIGHHQHQHGEGKERDVTEKPLIPVIVVHIPNGVDMDHE